MKNFVMSPMSVQIALTILGMGADDFGAEALGVYHLNPYYINVLGSLVLQAKSDPHLKIASSVFFSKKLKLRQQYERMVKSWLHSEVKELDFTDSTKAAKYVNNWCSENTGGMIKQLVSKDDFGGEVAAMILNAIHFKATWKEVFPEGLTKTKDFSTVDESGSISKVKVKMMSSYAKYYVFNNNHEELNAQIIALPYDDFYSYSMVIILPKEVNGIKNTMTKLKNIDMETVMMSLDSALVTVSLPKFKQEVTLNLTEELKKMGLSKLFSGETDLRLISDQRVNLGKVLQKTVISVAENGTEAAAATAMGIMQISGIMHEKPLKRYTFTADHPFLFFIMKRDTYIPIFEGVVMKPEF